jgi:hypothetical protein
MTIPAILPTNIDVIVQKNFSAIREVLAGRVSIDNFNFQTISGTTNTESDTEKLFNHSMTPRPVAWFPLVGDVYVQEISNKAVDVRSTKPGVNFKIILIGGNPVTGESLSAVGDDSYQDTNQQLQVDDLFVGDLNDLNILPHPSAVSGASALNYTSVATDGNYFYVTTSSTTSTSLYRISRTDGSRSVLTIFAGVGAGKIRVKKDEDKIYICTRAASGSNIVSVAEVKISTFTLTTTHSNTGTVVAADPILDFTDDQTSFYIVTTNINANRGTDLVKFAKGGGAATILTLSTTTGSLGLGCIYASDGNIYVTEHDAAISASKIYQVAPGTMTLTNTITTANRRYRMGQIVEYNGYLLCPAASDSGKSITSADHRFGAALLAIDLVTRTVSEYGLPGLHSGTPTVTTIPNNIVLKGSILYLVNAAVTQGTTVFRIDLANREIDMKWYPLFSVASNSFWDTQLIKDSDGEPLLLYRPGTTDIDNFCYLSPSFPVGFSPINIIG